MTNMQILQNMLDLLPNCYLLLYTSSTETLEGASFFNKMYILYHSFYKY
jgi:hypothetical protein